MARLPMSQNFFADARKNSSPEGNTQTWGSEAISDLPMWLCLYLCRCLEQGASGRTEQAKLVIGNDLDGHYFHKMPQTPFGEKCFEEHRCCELRQNFRSDTPCKEYTARCFDLK